VWSKLQSNGAITAYAASSKGNVKGKSWSTAGILGILVCFFGVHSFYLGNKKKVYTVGDRYSWSYNDDTGCCFL